jgi:cell division protein FtsL
LLKKKKNFKYEQNINFTKGEKMFIFSKHDTTLMFQGLPSLPSIEKTAIPVRAKMKRITKTGKSML